MPLADRRVQRERATHFVTAVNATVACERCSADGVEWHRVEHEEHPNWRVSSLRTQGLSLGRIAAEMLLSQPLCRRCHMAVDGRRDALFANQPNQPGTVVVPPKPCGCCSRVVKPTRKGLCVTCYNHQAGIRPRRTESCDGCCRA